MKVTVRYFGAIAEQTGVSEEVLDLSTIGSEVQQLRAYCTEKYHLEDDDTLQLAINRQLNKQGVLKDGDEIAFLPPFAGG